MEIQRAGLIQLPEGRKVRTTPSGRVAVFDVIASATGAKNPHDAWRRLAKAYPEVLAFCEDFKFQGTGQRATPVVALDGYLRLLHLLGGRVGQSFREAADRLILRYLEGDVTLAAEIADRQQDPAKLAWLEHRVRARSTNRLLNGSIHAAGGTCYATAARLNALGATGKLPRELREARGVKETRDGCTVGELAALAYAEALEAGAIQARGAQGIGGILAVVGEVSEDIAAQRRRYGAALPAPKPAPALPANSVAPASLETGRAFLSLLRAQGFTLWRKGELLMVRRPKGALTPEIARLISGNKPAILGALDEESSPSETPL
jgi:hypothetical protein